MTGRTGAALVALLLLPLLPSCRSTPVRGGDGALEGQASWYGPGFIGRATASGEIFTGRDLTAAHKTLPFGSVVEVEVTRPSSEAGRTVRVRINDRGPFVAGRIIDLSEAAARRIGLVRAGVLPVRLIVIRQGDGHRTYDDPDQPSGGPWLVQLGLFASYENARRHRFQAMVAVDQSVGILESAGFYRVVVGPVGSRKTAERILGELNAAGIDSLIIAAGEVPGELLDSPIE